MSVYLTRFSRSFFGEVKRRWQAFSSGLGSLSFPVFWPVIDVITGCLVWEYMFVLIWSGLTYNTDFCTYGRRLLLLADDTFSP